MASATLLRRAFGRVLQRHCVRPSLRAFGSAPDLFSATSDGSLSAAQVQTFRENGVLVLEGFASASEADAMRGAALAIVERFAASERDRRPTVFSTVEQKRTTDKYFLERSGRDRARALAVRDSQTARTYTGRCCTSGDNISE
jgi:hypothetical protein